MSDQEQFHAQFARYCEACNKDALLSEAELYAHLESQTGLDLSFWESGHER